MTGLDRVLFLHEYPGGFGGAERYLELLAGGLVARSVAASALVWSEERDDASRFVDRLEAAGVSPVTLRSGRSEPWSVARAVRRADPEVLHWNAVDPFAFRGGTLALLSRRPFVLTDHLPMLRTGVHWETTRRLVNRRAGAIIVVGEQGAAAARRHWPGLDHVVVVRNGVAARPAAGPGGPAGPGRLVFVGRLVPQKDPVFAVRVAGAAGLPMAVVGDGPLRSEVAAAAAGDVAMLGHRDDPAGDLRFGDVLVLPSTFEGLPFTPLEALAAGVPCVLSDIPPHREIAAAGEGVRLAPLGDLDGWVAAVRALVADPAAAAVAARRHGESFSLDAMVERTLDVYREVAGRAR